MDDQISSKAQFLKKKVVNDTHNFKNVLLSLATKHQQMFAYFLEGHSLFKPQLYVESLKVVETDR